MNGRLIYVVGPSGAGKDSVLDHARKLTPLEISTVFARRTITRPADAGGEQHVALSTAAFAMLRRQQAFAMSWQANGLLYGIGREILDWMHAGLNVVVNGSRQHLPVAASNFPDLVVVHVTAPPETLRQRLAARGREHATDIESRMVRATSFTLPTGLVSTTIVNNTTIEAAGEAFIELLARYRPIRPDVSQALRASVVTKSKKRGS